MSLANDHPSLSREQLLELLTQQEFALQAQEAQLKSYHEQLREQDMALQLKDQTITKLQQQNQEWELAYNELLQRAFRKQSERYLNDPDQLRIDFGDTSEAADAAQGLADAIEEQQEDQTIPEHRRRRRVTKRDEGLPAPPASL